LSHLHRVSIKLTLANAIYNGFSSPDDIKPKSLGSKAVLVPTNTGVASLNSYLLSLFPGSEVVYKSSDTVSHEEEALSFPNEFLNSVEYGGIPPHELKLKVGVPIMMLRNLNPEKGLCNGTRLICTSLTRYTIQASIVSGPGMGNTVVIPRIVLYSEVDRAGVEFKRLQFPVRLAFAMTINKSLAQTLNSVGIYLDRPVFSHGQLYVAMSRATSPQSVKILLDRNRSKIEGYEGFYTANIVYAEVL
jgi:ATP-dependent DNA helicase PIF1